MPQYDYVYLGDNARTPYGTRSFDVVYEFTKQSVKKLFDLGCPLVILGCNTASAKALKSIQTNDLPQWGNERRVLGVIRPTVEAIDSITKSRHVGILGTVGTIQSESYPIEIKKLFPDITVNGNACPMWVPLVENSEYNSDGADYFVKKELDRLLSQDIDIDTIVLACTHYPLLIDKIRKYVPKEMNIVSQGEIVAKSLENYLSRHGNMENHISRMASCKFYTTEAIEKFRKSASVFLHEEIEAERITLAL
jgi:glutamate racemase